MIEFVPVKSEREKVMENYSMRLFRISHRIHCAVSNCQKRHIICASFAFDELTLSLSQILSLFISFLLFAKMTHIPIIHVDRHR